MRLLRALLAAIALAPLCAQGQITNSSQPQTNPTPTALGGQISLGAFSSAANLILSFPPANLNPGTMAFTADQGEMIVINGSWQILGSGAGGGGANPTAQVGISAINGAANTFMRSDAAPALNVSISPTWLGVHTFTQTIAGSINGQSGTSLALAATPTQCTGAQFSTGIAANGNANCSTPSGSGTVSTTGSPANGNLAKFSAATTITNGDLSGDATTSGTLAVTVVKINNTTPGGSCTNQAVTSISSTATPTCTTLTSAYVNNSIALTGTDINTSNQVTGINGAAVPASLSVAATNSSKQLVAATSIGQSTTVVLLDPPQVTENANYTFVASDDGKEYLHSDATPRTYTLPANGSVGYNTGTCIKMTNLSGAAALTVVITTDTLRWPSPNSTGSRTVTAPGFLIACKEQSTEWWIEAGANISSLIAPHSALAAANDDVFLLEAA